MNVEDVRKELEIDRFNLEGELVGQPDLVYRVGMAQAKSASERDGWKEQIKLVEAQVGAEVRTKLSKPTEKAIQEGIELDKEVLESRDYFRKLTQQAREWEVCCESVRARGYVLHKLCDFALTEGAAIVGQSERERRQEVADEEVQTTLRKRRRRVVDNT